MRTSIDVYYPNALDCKITVNNNESLIEVIGTKLEDDLYRFDLSDIANIINNYQGKYNRFKIQYKYKLYDNEKEKWVNMFSVYRKNVIDRCEILIEDRQYVLDCEFTGDMPMIGRIWRLSNGNKYLINENIKLANGINKIESLNCYDFYKVDFFQVEEDEFGFEDNVNFLRSINLGYVDINNLINCRMDIKSIFMRVNV